MHDSALVPIKTVRWVGFLLSIVLIGASQSRSFTRVDGRSWTYTPRGYDVA